MGGCGPRLDRALSAGALSAVLGCGVWRGAARVCAPCAGTPGAVLPLVPRPTVAVATGTAWGSAAGVAGCISQRHGHKSRTLQGCQRHSPWCSGSPARAPHAVLLQAHVTQPCSLQASSIPVLPPEADVFLLPFQHQTLQSGLSSTLVSRPPPL